MQWSGSRNRMTTSSTSSELYRLRILERDEENGSVKVRYIGYGEDFDEWRKEEDIVNLEEDDSSADGTPPFSCQPELPTFTKYCLYKEIAFRIKSMLYSNRKADPLCSILMSFDTVHFEGLIRRGIRRNEVGGKKEMYGLALLTKLDDLLGEMWYIRGLNDVGDFCYIEPSTVKCYLRSCKGKLDYRLKEDGTIVPTYLGQGINSYFSLSEMMAPYSSGIKFFSHAANKIKILIYVYNYHVINNVTLSYTGI